MRSTIFIYFMVAFLVAVGFAAPIMASPAIEDRELNVYDDFESRGVAELVSSRGALAVTKWYRA